LKKADEQGIKLGSKFDYKALATNIEKQLLKDLIFYPQIILAAQQKNDPAILAQFLFGLSQNFNTFYHELPVLKADEKIKLARLVLIKSIRQVLENGLVLIGNVI
jgi:arginyl-tRNA synthetase